MARRWALPVCPLAGGQARASASMLERRREVEMTDHSADAAAITAVLHANRIAALTKDFEAYENCVVHTPYPQRWHGLRFSGVFVR